MYASTATLAALAASFATVYAGTAAVQNNCDADVYLWSISDSADATMQTLSSGDSYSEAFQTNSNGGGISIKLSMSSDQTTVTQFEYTLDDSTIFYDVSNINGYPFEDWGLDLVASDSTCPAVACDAGVEVCESAYNLPDDNWATLSCDSTAELTLTLCSGSVTSKPKPKARRHAIPPQARHLHQHFQG